MSALARLIEDYSSSGSDEENDIDGKRKLSSPTMETNSKRHKSSSAVAAKTDKQLLPVPAELLSMFSADTGEDLHDPDKHEGRARSFPHERGNWATHVYISYTTDDFFDELVGRLLSNCKYLKPNREFHISLSKTVVLKYHWINLFTSALKKKFGSFRKSIVIFDALAVYVNEEKSRTFLGLKITADEFLKELTEKANETLKEFDLPGFYEESSFHLTIGWCLGDLKQQLLSSLPKLEEELLSFCQDNAERWPFMKVEEILCRTGNKLFSFPLL